MPTGYTAGVVDNDYTFPQFIWRCARAFGALIMMRDDSFDAKIKLRKVEQYYIDDVAKAEQRLLDVINMSDSDAAVAVTKAYNTALLEREISSAKRSLERRKYENMLREAEKWQPPTKDHEGLKEFMISQLKETIKFDFENMDSYYDKPVVKQDPADYVAAEIKFANQDVKRAKERLANEMEAVAKTNGWVKDLAASVPMPKELR